jgi:hypothetical protein
MNTIELHPTLQALLALLPQVVTPSPGVSSGSYLFEDLPAHIYHADRDALSSSLIKPLLISPAHFQASLANPFKRTDAMDFGSLLHLLVLEPQLVESEVAVFPGIKDGRDADFKSFAQANSAKLVVDEDTFASGLCLVPKILERKYKGKAIGKYLEESSREVSLYYTDPITGLLIRTRPDIYHPDVTFDLKTTRCSTGPDFVRDAVSLHYDLSSFMYSLGRSLFEGTQKPKPFIFLTVETFTPHSVSVVEAGASFLNNGARKYQECLSVYAACMETGYWPDLGVEMVAEIEPWLQFNPAPSDWRSKT